MPRARTIKPGFFTNDQLGELPALTRLLFIGLWTMADREGRLLDRPKKIKAEILPYDTAFNVDKGLQQLAERGFILRYSASNLACIQILHWRVHQRPHPQEGESEVPVPVMDIVSASSMHDPSALMSTGVEPEAVLLNAGVEPEVHHDLTQAVPVSRAEAFPSGSFPSVSFNPPTPLAGADRGVVPKPKRERVPITDPDIEDLVAKYVDRYGTPQAVRDEIDLALNHQARFKNLSERLYVDGWLRRELTHRPGQRVANGRPEPPRQLIDRTGIEN